MNDERQTITSACPNCGDVAERSVYDIGSGLELSCASCEWCWGADGQSLKPCRARSTLSRCELVVSLIESSSRRVRDARHADDGHGLAMLP
jgi:hypothetical protein